MPTLDRRAFLAGLAASVAASSAPAVIDKPASTKKIAAIATAYFRYSHADNIITRFMEGYSIVGKSYPPPCHVASLYIDQADELDIGKPLARRWKIPLAKSIPDALTLGTSKLAVDGVVIVAEHGDYELNDRGVTLYPRKKFFEQVVKVFADSKRSVPVFNDKHLSYSWDEAKWMYEQSQKLGFPMMAGSSVPGSYRKPQLKPKDGTVWDAALAVGYGHFEIYGFHTLEALQAMVENRKGGETGVKAVTCLRGKAAWETKEKWGAQLLDAVAAVTPGNAKGKIEEDDKEALVYQIEYADGLNAGAYISPRHFREFGFGGQARGEKKPAACWFELPKPQRDHFSFLVNGVAKMIETGKATWPVERTLLATGMLAFGIDSKAADGKRIETPELAVKYGG